mmetsp:Transcript_825/g.2067  ORF Transcript_825/g.2067 Transcript_825/m.2067 type:complete len:421 (+) Transcript_825:64-1326(+)|eukprot:CAMPEP_0195112606 /NCGR_PEP_ID=MMETSP0448-20130528/99612_1 /TAXON_ID=66468 /ORGANISM="Heterocapsa triquestra, Strain CCMP 448" /LENGTH=420 /DNA_ID=CAMNT_0040149469 /DNA_START=63 /DNA_END=1325 /DNA_ORIENTATION=+
MAQGLPTPELVDRALFPAPSATYTADCFPGELIWIPKRRSGPEGDGLDDRIPCLLLRSPAAQYFVLALHSNGDDLGRFRSFCSRLRLSLAVHVLAVEYPGYGICPGGQATPASTTANANAAYRFLRDDLCWPESEIIVFGRSIGCGPALSIAAENNVHGVIIVSPFLSVRSLLRHYLGPLADLVAERFPNIEMIRRIKSRLLLVHGQQDKMVPVSHGQALFDTCVCQKLLVTPERMSHNTNLHADESFLVVPMMEFFSLSGTVRKPVIVPEWAFDRPSPYRYDDGLLSSAFCCKDGCREPVGNARFSKAVVCDVPAAQPAMSDWPMSELPNGVVQLPKSARWGARQRLPEQLCTPEALEQPLHNTLRMIEQLPDQISDTDTVMDADLAAEEAARLEAAAQEAARGAAQDTDIVYQHVRAI